MNYKCALESLYNTKEGRNILLNDPFLAYSKMSDLVGNSYQDCKLIKLYFILNNSINVIKSIDDIGIEDTLVRLISYYKKLKDKIDILDFKLSVKYIVELFDPHYFSNNVLKKEDKDCVKVIRGL